MALLAGLVGVALGGAPPIRVDRTWQILPEPKAGELTFTLEAAARELGSWTIEVAGVELDGPALAAIAESAQTEPLTRALREATRRPVDAEGLLLLLDDVLVAGEAGRRGERFVITSGRARSAGVLVHPDEVWKGKDRPYAAKPKIYVDPPREQESFPLAQDGEPPGPNWTMRYRNPDEREALLALLAEGNPGYAERIASLITQLEAQGAEVWLTSTVRSQERGYLMWGAFILSRCETAAQVEETIATLEDRNQRWDLHVPIQWAHPDGWRATVEAARLMKETYDVVYATEGGARSSDHYGDRAVDVVALGLPRVVSLVDPEGEPGTFDLSHPDQTRDLSMTPELVEWIEERFEVRKLRTDYPHWDDVYQPRDGATIDDPPGDDQPPWDAAPAGEASTGGEAG